MSTNRKVGNNMESPFNNLQKEILQRIEDCYDEWRKDDNEYDFEFTTDELLAVGEIDYLTARTLNNILLGLTKRGKIENIGVHIWGYPKEDKPKKENFTFSDSEIGEVISYIAKDTKNFHELPKSVPAKITKTATAVIQSFLNWMVEELYIDHKSYVDLIEHMQSKFEEIHGGSPKKKKKKTPKSKG